MIQLHMLIMNEFNNYILSHIVIKIHALQTSIDIKCINTMSKHDLDITRLKTEQVGFDTSIGRI